MSQSSLLVKNMVCQRCLLAVENILEKTSIKFQRVVKGEIYLDESLSNDQYALLSDSLSAIGLELINNKKYSIVEKIKQFVIRKARNEVGDKENRMNLSSYLSKNLFFEYSYLSCLFSSRECRTIESYFIQQRVEKVKELLLYNEMSVSAIAFEMDYSSVAHLSNQFKQITGFTPSHFKQVNSIERKLVDQI